MAHWIRPSLLCRTRIALGLALVLLTAGTARAQDVVTAPSESMLGTEALALRLSHGAARPAMAARPFHGMVAATVAVTAPQRTMALDGSPSESAPPLRPSAWHSGLGLTLSGGDRIGVRRADGGTQLVWRRQF